MIFSQSILLLDAVVHVFNTGTALYATYRRRELSNFYPDVFYPRRHFFNLLRHCDANRFEQMPLFTHLHLHPFVDIGVAYR